MKFVKVMFYMCLSVHRGSTWAGTPLGRYTPQASTPLWASTPSWAGTPSGHVHPLPPGRYTPSPGRYTPLAGRPPPAVAPPGQVHPQGCTPPGQIHPPAIVHARIRSTKGRYASHWNAFLLYSFLERHLIESMGFAYWSTSRCLQPSRCYPCVMKSE